MKKIYVFISTTIILILVLSIVLVILEKNIGKEKSLPAWSSKQNEFLTSTAQIGRVSKVLKLEGKTELNSDYFVTYRFTDVDESNIIVKNKQIVDVGDLICNKSNFKVDSLGRIEDISFLGNDATITISNLHRFLSKIKVHQSYITNIKLGEKVSIRTINDDFLEGVLKYHNYTIDENGYLEIVLEIENNDVLMIGQSIEVDYLISYKDNVLIVPYDTLEIENMEYYLNVLNDDKVSKVKVEVGIIGNDYVEIKKGITVGATVIINQYD